MGEVAEAAVAALRVLLENETDIKATKLVDEALADKVKSVINILGTEGGKHTASNIYKSRENGGIFSNETLEAFYNVLDPKVQKRFSIKKEITTSPSQQKCDVSIKINNEILNTSLKNYYSTEQGIHLVGSSPLSNMINGMQPDFVFHWLNVISAYDDDPGKSLTNQWSTIHKTM